jgi:hypothetical protein
MTELQSLKEILAELRRQTENAQANHDEAFRASKERWDRADAAARRDLRDYFAGQALAGLAYLNHLRGDRDAERIAEEAYAYASAMLSQREKP